MKQQQKKITLCDVERPNAQPSQLLLKSQWLRPVDYIHWLAHSERSRRDRRRLCIFNGYPRLSRFMRYCPLVIVLLTLAACGVCVCVCVRARSHSSSSTTSSSGFSRTENWLNKYYARCLLFSRLLFLALVLSLSLSLTLKLFFLCFAFFCSFVAFYTLLTSDDARRSRHSDVFVCAQRTDGVQYMAVVSFIRTHSTATNGCRNAIGLCHWQEKRATAILFLGACGFYAFVEHWTRYANNKTTSVCTCVSSIQRV